jgi:hypothetical protein
MAEEQKSQTLVETNKAVAAGIASVVVGILTSKLGVAGTLIGTGLTAMLITLASAILKAQLEKASHRVAGLPSAVQGRLSTQQIRVPGKQSPEPNPEPTAKPETARGRLSGLLSRLGAIPGFFRNLPSNQKRKVLLAGALAGLVAAVIGLSGVTGIELVGGKNLSCLVWSECPTADTSSRKPSSGSGPSILGGYSGGVTRNTPSDTPSGEQQITPGNNQQAPQQPSVQPAQLGPGGGVPQQPGGTPKQGAEDQVQPGAEGSVKPAPQPSGKAREQGQEPGAQNGY